MNKKYKQLACLTIVLLAFLSVSLFTNYNFAKAEESSTAQSEVDLSHLDDDNIAGSDLTIRDYPEQLHATKASVRMGGNSNENAGYYFYNPNEDDPIINIVPKEYFYTENQTLKIGTEYGFFINTVKTENKNYLSTVLVFDITLNSDLETTFDRVIVDVSPIFQYQYLGITTDSRNEEFFYVNFRYERFENPIVLAYPSYMEMAFTGPTLEYNMVENYYLKDISFGASLFNEQELNYGDPGYNPHNDYGSYFTGFDYSYQGRYRERGEFDGAGLAWNILDTVFHFLGYLEDIPVVGKVVSVLGEIYSHVSLGSGWLEWGGERAHNLADEIKTEENKITATCLYQNRDDQLKYYRDNNGNPVLAKVAAIAVETDDERSMWYGVGDNVAGYFSIGHSALDGRAPDYTRFINQIALRIVNSDGDEVVAAGDTIIQCNLREQTIKEIDCLGTGDIYLLPNGADSLVYRDTVYESDYTMRVNLSSEASVMVNGTVKTGKNLVFNIHAKEHDDIDIYVYGNEVGLKGNVDISLNETTNIGAIYPNGRYILKTNVSDIKTVDTGNQNLIIEHIYYYKDNALTQYETYVPFVEGSSVTLPFDSDKDYYFIIHNEGDSVVYNAALTITGIQSFQPEQSITVTPNVKAMSFVNTYDKETSFQLGIPNDSGVKSIAVYNTNGIQIASRTLFASGETKYYFGLQANEVCYFFFNITATSTIEVTRDELYFKWELDGQIYNVSYNMALQRGKTYNLRLVYIKDGETHAVDADFKCTEDPARAYSYENNVLTITYDLPIGFVIMITARGYFDATLNITVTAGREDIDYIVTFDKKGGTGGTDSVVAHYNREMPSATAPSRVGYRFGGYYEMADAYGTMYYSSNMSSNVKWDKEKDVTLYAYWIPNTYTITFEKNGGVGGTSSIVVNYGEQLPLIEFPKKTANNFLGYYTYGKGTCYYEFFDINLLPEDYYYLYHAQYCDFTYNIKLYAYWEEMTWSVSVWASLSDRGKTLMNDECFSLKANEQKTFYVPGIVDYDTQSWELTYQAGKIAAGTNTAINMTNLCVGNYNQYTLTINYLYNPQQSSCVAAGTLITLADGRQVPVESLTGSEMLLVWNFKTGTFDSAPILFIDKDPLRVYKVINLYFSDGTVVEVISEHGFWNSTLNKYVYLDENASEYVGDWFNKQTIGENGVQTWTTVQLVDVQITEKETTAYSPVTAEHLCYYVNGMLSMPGGINGLFNIFEVDGETMKYNAEKMAADIEQYGVFTYEDFEGLISEEMFNALNGQYLKVAVGKKLTNKISLEVMIEKYSRLFKD